MSDFCVETVRSQIFLLWIAAARLTFCRFVKLCPDTDVKDSCVEASGCRRFMAVYLVLSRMAVNG